MAVGTKRRWMKKRKILGDLSLKRRFKDRSTTKENLMNIKEIKVKKRLVRELILLLPRAVEVFTRSSSIYPVSRKSISGFEKAIYSELNRNSKFES